MSVRTPEVAKVVQTTRFELGRVCREGNATPEYVRRLVGRLVTLGEEQFLRDMAARYPAVLGGLVGTQDTTPKLDTPMAAGIDPTPPKPAPKKRGRKPVYTLVVTNPKYESLKWIANVLFTGCAQPATRLRALVDLIDKGHEIGVHSFTMPYDALLLDGAAVEALPLMDEGKVIPYVSKEVQKPAFI